MNANWMYEALAAVVEADESEDEKSSTDTPAKKAEPKPEPKAEPKPEPKVEPKPKDDESKPQNLARFLLFGGERYYPLGGWSDFKSMHTTPGAALNAASVAASEWDWWQIVDLRTQKIVRSKNLSATQE